MFEETPLGTAQFHLIQSFSLFLFFNFWLCHMACGIVVSQSGIEPASPALEAQSLHHQTTVEDPACSFAFWGFSYSRSTMVQNIEWKIPEIKNKAFFPLQISFSLKLFILYWSIVDLHHRVNFVCEWHAVQTGVKKSRAQSWWIISLFSASPCCILHPPTSHQVAIWVVRSTVMVLRCFCSRDPCNFCYS